MVRSFPTTQEQLLARIATRRSRRATAPEKPFLEMHDLEWARAWDRTFDSLDRGLLADARDGERTMRIAAAVLKLVGGHPRVVFANSEAGDSEGTVPVAQFVARGRSL